MSKRKNRLSAGVELHDGKLFGLCGGQLEYAGQKMVVRKNERTDIHQWFVILYFTDHDMWVNGTPSISNEIYAHYAIEVPCSGFETES